MNEKLITQLAELNIFIPRFWDAEYVLTIIATKDSMDLLELLDITPAKLRKTIKQIFPNKPDNLSYMEYAKAILKELDFSEIENV